MSAFTHIVLGTNNLSNSTKFYDATLGALGLKNMGLLTEDNYVQYGVNTPEFMIESGLWAGQSLYELYKKAFMPWEWHKPLFEYA